MLARAAGLRSSSTRSSRARSRRISRTVAERPRPAVRRLRRPASASRRRCPTEPISLGLAGTAPGARARASGTRRRRAARAAGRASATVARALETEPFCACSRGARPPDRRVLRFFGASESAVARALAEAGGDGDGVEATICARDFEIHVDLFVEPGAEERADALGALRCVNRSSRYLFARRRAAGRGDRAPSAARRGLDARDGGVVHGRAGRRATDRRAGRERGVPRRRRRVLGRRQGRRARRAGGDSRARTAPSRPRRPRRWRRVRARGWGWRWPSR